MEDSVIRTMQKHDFDGVKTRTYVLNNRHNHITAAYYLFLKKKERSGVLKKDV